MQQRMGGLRLLHEGLPMRNAKAIPRGFAAHQSRPWRSRKRRASVGRPLGTLLFCHLSVFPAGSPFS
jgi:hypothetical protein